MKWTRANAFCLGVLAASPALGQTLEQAVENTLKTNPDIKSAFNEFVSKQYVNEASSGAYLPLSTLTRVLDTKVSILRKRAANQRI